MDTYLYLGFLLGTLKKFLEILCQISHFKCWGISYMRNLYSSVTSHWAFDSSSTGILINITCALHSICNGQNEWTLSIIFSQVFVYLTNFLLWHLEEKVEAYCLLKLSNWWLFSFIHLYTCALLTSFIWSWDCEVVLYALWGINIS